MKFILSLILLLTPSLVSAATLSIDPSTTMLQVGDTVELSVSLSTEGEIVNAIDGGLILPSQLKFKEVRYSGSVVPFWLEAPKVREGSVLNFSGVLPGGYQNGSREATIVGNMFTVVLEAVTEGKADITLTPTTSVYLNDGEGTKTSLSRTPATLTIKGVNGSPANGTLDTVVPESFTPEIVSGTLFGKEGRMLVFIAQDKDSGIARYKISRSFIPGLYLSGREAQSPEPLTLRDTFGFIRIRAIDEKGNSTDASIAPGGIFSFVPLIIVVLIALIMVLLIRNPRAIIQRR